MRNNLRLLVLAVTATIAALSAGGCNMPSNVAPQPINPMPATKHTVEITVSGSGQVNVAGNADLNVKNAEPDQPRAGACDCGCNHSSLSDCKPACPRRVMSRPNAPSTTAAQGSAPQLLSTTQRVYECRNGVCGWYDVPVQKLAQSVSSGRIKVYLQPDYLTANGGNNASLAMRKAIGESADIDWVYGQPPAVNGRATWPTAVIGDRVWASGDWTHSSAARFREWQGRR